MRKELTNEYIRGLVERGGSFTFCTVPTKKQGKTTTKARIPAFVLTMSKRDKDLILAIKKHLGLSNRIYEIMPYTGDGYKREGTVRLMIRDIGTLKNIIIPLFNKKLVGHKSVQFVEWLEKIGNDPSIPESYKLLYRLWKQGFYNKNT
jgi:hypothetical protein